MRKTTFLTRKLREVSFLSRGLLSTRHVVLAHLIPMRRCNLACGYCNEYDHTSSPVPLDVIKRRIDKLADLGTSIVTISGGEPMMHPQLDDIIHHIRLRGMIAGLISNGYYFTPERIKRLNKAGLEYLQISIDNVDPDEVSRKSLRVLDKKLRYLSEYADFHVNINSVIGGGIKNPEDALAVARRAVELGFSTTVGVIHDNDGTLKPLSAKRKTSFSRSRNWATKTTRGSIGFRTASPKASLTTGVAAPARAISTFAKTVWSIGARSSEAIPGIPLEDYTMEDFEREYNTEKWCAPTCTLQCVHQVGILDNWRDPPKNTCADGCRAGKERNCW